MKFESETEQINGYQAEFQDLQEAKNLDSIHEIIEEYVPQGGQFSFTLHKWDDTLKKYPQINKWRNIMPPDKHEIGIMYGSGRYQFFLKWPDKSKKLGYALFEEKFDLHRSYDELKAQADADKKKAEQTITAPILSGHSDKIYELMLNQANQQINLLVGLFGKMIESIGSRGGVESPMDKYFPLLLENTMKSKETDSERLFTMYNKGLEMGSLNQIENTKDTSWKDLLKDLIPQLPEMVNSAAKMFVPKQTIRSIALNDERAKKILAAPGGKQEFVNEMIKTHGQEKTAETFKKAGLEDLMSDKPQDVKPTLKVF